MKRLKKNNGITLISLVITIIVMLILVGVSISMVVNGGLFSYAGNAVKDTENEKNKEKDIANGGIEIDGKTYRSITEYLEGIPPNPEEKFSEIYTENTTITEKIDGKEYKAVIPKGFAVGKSDGINTIAEGLVITDKVNSEGQSIGNEFVWIPVEVVKEGENPDSETSIASFYRSDWVANDEDEEDTGGKRGTTLSSSYTEPYVKGYTDGKGTEEIKEYNEMLASVYNNEGFYIGRYEAGSTVARTEAGINEDGGNGTTTMVVQRDVYPYNYVAWGAEMTDYASEITYASKNQGLGALALSKRMYPTKEMCDGDSALAYKDVGVTSTLCYGVMWDAMLDFIKDDSHNVTNSTTWGNYSKNEWKITRTTAQWYYEHTGVWVTVGESGAIKGGTGIGTLLTTGASDDFCAKNVFDVAGNVYEWTMEAYNWSWRVLRGGCWYGYFGYPASYRSGNDYDVFNPKSYVGFRPTLYIK